jgi:hypothetical protein
MSAHRRIGSLAAGLLVLGGALAAARADTAASRYAPGRAVYAMIPGSSIPAPTP